MMEITLFEEHFAFSKSDQESSPETELLNSTNKKISGIEVILRTKIETVMLRKRLVSNINLIRRFTYLDSK